MRCRLCPEGVVKVVDGGVCPREGARCNQYAVAECHNGIARPNGSNVIPLISVPSEWSRIKISVVWARHNNSVVRVDNEHGRTRIGPRRPQMGFVSCGGSQHPHLDSPVTVGKQVTGICNLDHVGGVRAVGCEKAIAADLGLS